MLLYVDGSGDATVEWSVDVTYEGYEDSDFLVYGTITVANLGLVDVEVTGVSDEVDGVPATVVCEGITFPHTLQAATVELTDSFECTYELELTEAADGDNIATASITPPDNDPTLTEFVSDAVPYTFGDPTTELFATVGVVDDSDLNGVVVLGVLHASDYTAGDIIEFDYTHDFAYSADDECVETTYENTASVLGFDPEARVRVTLDSDTASVVVKIQCLIFQGETAWAANGDTPGSLRYTNRGNWATYVAYAQKTTTLFAGQTINVGTVEFGPVIAGEVTITVNLSGDWEFADAGDNLKVQGYASAPSGNPAPGQFANKTTCDTTLNTCSITVPEANYYGVHVDVGIEVPDPEFGL